nr:MAG: nonstructural protein [Microvirus sp.]
MLLKFSIYDSKAEAFITPFYQPTAGVALRMFEAAANDPSTTICLHSGDFTLFELGSWDPLTGDEIQLETKINHGLAIQYQTNQHNTSLPITDTP